MGKAAALDKLSIISRGKGVGHLSILTDDTLFPTRTDIEAAIAIAMAGLAAEKLVLGEFSVGSEDDLERATTLARDLAGRYGMSDRLGRVRILADQREVFLGRDYLSTKEVSQPTLEHLDTEVRQILDDQETLATTLLASHRAILDDLADALVNQETLKGPEPRRRLHDVRPYRRPPSPTAPAPPAEPPPAEPATAD
jgi:cell division protease FtsH